MYGRRAARSSADAAGGFDPLSAPPPAPAPATDHQDPAPVVNDAPPSWLDDVPPPLSTQPTAVPNRTAGGPSTLSLDALAAPSHGAAGPAMVTAPSPNTTPGGFRDNAVPTSTATPGGATPAAKTLRPAYVPPWGNSPVKAPQPQPVMPGPSAGPAAAVEPAAASNPPPPAAVPTAAKPRSASVSHDAPTAAPVTETGNTGAPAEASKPPLFTPSPASPPAAVQSTPVDAAATAEVAPRPSTALLLALRERARELQKEEAAVIERCSSLLSKPSLSASVESRAQQTAFDAKRLELTNRIHEGKTRHREAVDVAMRQRAERLSSLRSEGREAHVDAARARMNDLAAKVAEADTAVRELRREVQFQMKNSEDSIEERAALNLSKQLHELFAAWRHGTDAKSIAVLREATRERLSDVSQKQQRAHDESRADRAAALRRYQEQRQEAFHVARRSRRENHKRSADGFFASLKVARERHLKEAAATTAGVAVRHERELEQAAAVARAEAKAALERTVVRHRAAAQEEWVSLENALRRREADVAEELLHKKKIMEGDAQALKRRIEVDLQSPPLAAASNQKDPSAGVRQVTQAELQLQRKKLRDTTDAALVALKGLEAQRKLPSAFKTNLVEREAVLANTHQSAAVKTASLQQQWTAVAAQINAVGEVVARLHERAAVGRSDINAAQQRVDSIRAAWEKEERAILSRTDLPTADNAHADVLFDIAAQLRDVTDRQTRLRDERLDTDARHCSVQCEVEDAHAAFAKQFFALLGQYDEVATTLAAVEAKRRHLDNEAEDQRLAKASLDAEWKDVARGLDRAQQASEAARKEAAVLAAASRRPRGASSVDGGGRRPGGSSIWSHLSGGTRHALHMQDTATGHGGASTWADFSTLLRLPEDSSSAGTYSTARPPASQSMTTPSPDTDGS